MASRSRSILAPIMVAVATVGLLWAMSAGTEHSAFIPAAALQAVPDSAVSSTANVAASSAETLLASSSLTMAQDTNPEALFYISILLLTLIVLVLSVVLREAPGRF